MKAIVVFLAKQKNYGRVLIMQQCPPNSGGQAISEASFVEEGKGNNGSEPFGLFKFGKRFGRLGFGKQVVETRSEKSQLKS